MVLTSKREAVQWIHDAWRFKHSDRCVKFDQNTLMTSFCQIFIFQFRITSIQIVSFLILFPILLRLCCSFPYPRFVIQITENMFIIFYAAIFSYRMPMPSLSIFLKDLSVFKITEICSIYNHFFFFIISYVILGKTVFANTCQWSEFWKICLHG